MGVPQGSILAPLLFIIFINDMASDIKGAKIVYADDTNIFLTGNSLCEVTDTASATAHLFHEWCINNGLLLNISKTQFMSFLPKNVCNNFSSLVRINHKSIEQVNNTKFLGMFIDEKMTWEKQINELTSQLSSACFVLRQLKNTVSLHILKMAYFGLVQSKLQYGLMFWGNSSYMQKAFVSQKRIIRCISGIRWRDSCRREFKRLRILTLPCLYILQVTLNIYKYRNEQQCNNAIHNHSTRNADSIHQPFSRLVVGQNSHNYQGIKFYNKLKTVLDVSGKVQSFTSFKNVLTNYLTEQAFYSVDEFLMQ